MNNERISKYIWMGIASLLFVLLTIKANEFDVPFHTFIPAWGILLWCIYNINNKHLKNKDRLLISILCALEIFLNVCMFLSSELHTILAILLFPLSIVSFLLFALVISKARHLKVWIITELVVSVLSLLVSLIFLVNAELYADDDNVSNEDTEWIIEDEYD